MITDCFDCIGNCYLIHWMKMYLSTGTTVVEPPIIIKPGMLSSPADLVGLSLLTAFVVEVTSSK